MKNTRTDKYTIIFIIGLFLIPIMGIVSYGADEQSTPETQTPPPSSPSTETPVEKTPSDTPPLTPPEPVTPTYHILPAFKMNDEITVEEEQKWDGTLVIKTGNSTKSYPYYKQIFQHYTEKIGLITPDQLNFKSERYYLGSAMKSKMPDVGTKTMPISLKGKTFSLESKNCRIVSYEKIAPKEATVISEDYSYINSFNWFYSLLPDADTVLSVGTSYPIKSNDLKDIIFKGHFNERSSTINGKGVLEEIINQLDSDTGDKPQLIRLLINLKIKQNRTDNSNFTAELTGFCKISISSAPSLELDISGPFTMIQSSPAQGEQKVSYSTNGFLTLKSKVMLKK